MMTRRQARRTAFAHRDLLAALTAVFLTASIAAPAVYQANEKNDRAVSTNNLKQLVLATHNAHDTYGKLPQIIGTLGGKQASLHYHLLPYLEQVQVYQNGNLAAPIEVMRGPGDRSAPAGGVYKQVYGTTNYAGNFFVFKGGPTAPDFGNLGRIPDGTSNTIMYAERYQVCNGTPCLWGYGQFYYWAPMFAYYSQGKFQVHPTQENCNPALPQSMLRAGILVGMCDGVVRLVGNHIGPDTWSYAVHPADGNVLPREWDN
jgi:hypothetical protein